MILALGFLAGFFGSFNSSLNQFASIRSHSRLFAASFFSVLLRASVSPWCVFGCGLAALWLGLGFPLRPLRPLRFKSSQCSPLFSVASSLTLISQTNSREFVLIRVHSRLVFS